MNTFKETEITREQFLAYRRVQESGRYNMVMEWREAASASGLTKDQYFAVINNYSELYKQYIGD